MQHAHPFLPRPTVRTLAALWTLALLAPLAGAQRPAAASEGFIALQPEAASGVARSTSAVHDVEWSLGHGFQGSELTSESFVLSSGALLDQGTLAGQAPLVAGVRQPSGSAGESAQVLGFGFTAPGAGSTSVEFDGQPAGASVVASNTRIVVEGVPAVTNEHGNPRVADVHVANALGADRAPRAYAYLPTLLEGGPTSLAGGELRLDAVSEDGLSALLLFGETVPGLAIPVTDFTGTLEVLVNLKVVGTGVFADGVAPFAFPLPSNPALAGQSVAFQGCIIESLTPLGGSFTNATTVVLQP